MSVATKPLEYRRIERQQYGVTRLGQAVDKIVLTNANGLKLEAIEFGAIITRIFTKDRNGATGNIVLGYDMIEQYEDCPFYVGAAIGRYAGRIANAEYDFDGRRVTLDSNCGRHHLHGGAHGFHKAIWSAKTREDRDSATASFFLLSPKNEGGHPGELAVSITYTLTDRDELIIEYDATTDNPTHVNLTQHSYFHLGARQRNSAENLHLTVNADALIEISDDALPTGEVIDVAETPYDFRSARQIGPAALELDHDFVLPVKANELVRTAQLFDPASGRCLDVSTNQPSLHVYAGGSLSAENGSGFPRCAGVCLETQHFPDSPNNEHFPSTLLLPGKAFQSQTVLTFGAKNTGLNGS